MCDGYKEEIKLYMTVKYRISPRGSTYKQTGITE